MNQKLARDIQKMAKLDQEVRKQEDQRVIIEVTKMNIAKLREIVRQYGWPTISLVGKQASYSAWLLVQHADHDLKFQKHCLKLMKKAMTRGEVLKENVAYLTDRILTNTGKPQLYGTQFENIGGKLAPKPIKDPDRLDARRKKMALQPFKAYQKKMQILKMN